MDGPTQFRARLPAKYEVARDCNPQRLRLSMTSIACFYFPWEVPEGGKR